MVRDDHLLMIHLFERTIACLSHLQVDRSEEVFLIAKDLRFHATHLLEVHFPLEHEIFSRIRESQPALTAEVEELILDRQKFESWLLTIKSMLAGGDFNFDDQGQGLKILIINYCVRKLVHIEQESQWVLPTADATFSDDDWREVENTLDRILFDRDKTTPGDIDCETSKHAKFWQSM